MEDESPAMPYIQETTATPDTPYKFHLYRMYMKYGA